MITREDLDKRICDVEGGDNDETYREFIRSSEKMLEMEEGPIDKYTDVFLNEYIEWLDYLWSK